MYNGSPRYIDANLRPRVADILTTDAAGSAADMDLPGLRLHERRGDQEGVWSVTVNANWRVTFRFLDGNAHDVDLVDYHWD